MDNYQLSLYIMVEHFQASDDDTEEEIERRAREKMSKDVKAGRPTLGKRLAEGGEFDLTEEQRRWFDSHPLKPELIDCCSGGVSRCSRSKKSGTPLSPS